MKQIALKPEGEWEVRRTVHVQGLSGTADGPAIQAQIESLKGVRKASVEPSTGRVAILYDPRETEYGTLCEALRALGHPPAEGRWSRLKGGLYRFLDGNIRDNAKIPPRPCCNRSPK